jgi:CheY-like chemotaxis protein
VPPNRTQKRMGYSNMSERVDLARLTRHVVALPGGPCNRPALTTLVQVPETPIWVPIDRDVVEAVVTELLRNSSESITMKGVLEIALEPDQNARRAAMSVRDSGVGFEPNDAEKQFDLPAEKGHVDMRALRDRVRGLAGDVLVSSRGMGHGSEFTMLLPMLEEESVVKEPPPLPPSVARKRILIVEDNRDGADTLSRFLQLAGHDVRIAGTGPEGLRIALEIRPEFILCDIGLPDLDGYHLADELRKAPATAHAHLIAITGYGSERDRERSRIHGFEHHITKPADAESLLELIRSTDP